ncbi:MAG TPA: sialate O-acetylesterase [Pirellulaceae bacterium]|nr:sialate O-acetylesterase [Pirellulaceae bacterium]
MRQRWFAVALMLTVIGASAARGDVRLPKVFGDSMVLQQQSQAAVWGWADADEEVTVSLGETKATAKAGADGKWLTKIQTPTAGGPHTLTVKGKNEITLKDVYVGEVWICSGQSNMEWTVAQSANPADEAKTADDPQIRMIKVEKIPSQKPADDIQGQWQVCSPESAPKFSAVGYFFARHLHNELKVPIGMINTSWGGTICEAWTSDEALKTDPDFQPILQRSAQFKPGQPNQASVLYNGMIKPLVPMTIRGAIWYQGESNVGRAVQYRKLFPTMIADWRKQFGQGDFPFLFVQLAPYKYGEPHLALAELWEAQLMTLSVPHTGMCVTWDIGDVGDIHPKNKQDVGKRLALWALANTYGKSDVVYSGPLYDSMVVEGNKIRVKFKHTAGGLASKEDKPLTHFQIAGDDQKFVDAKATIDGETVVVESDQVPAPKAVRFAWHGLAEPNLFNKAGLPASPFRTDEWPLTTASAK